MTFSGPGDSSARTFIGRTERHPCQFEFHCFGSTIVLSEKFKYQGNPILRLLCRSRPRPRHSISRNAVAAADANGSLAVTAATVTSRPTRHGDPAIGRPRQLETTCRQSCERRYGRSLCISRRILRKRPSNGMDRSPDEPSFQHKSMIKKLILLKQQPVEMARARPDAGRRRAHSFPGQQFVSHET